MKGNNSIFQLEFNVYKKISWKNQSQFVIKMYFMALYKEMNGWKTDYSD